MGPIVAETRTDKRHNDLQSRGAITKLRSGRDFGDGREQELFEGKDPTQKAQEKLDGPREKLPEEIEREKRVAQFTNCARNVLVCLPPSAHPDGQEYYLELYLASRLVCRKCYKVHLISNLYVIPSLLPFNIIHHAHIMILFLVVGR